MFFCQGLDKKTKRATSVRLCQTNQQVVVDVVIVVVVVDVDVDVVIVVVVVFVVVVANVVIVVVVVAKKLNVRCNGGQKEFIGNRSLLGLSLIAVSKLNGLRQ